MASKISRVRPSSERLIFVGPMIKSINSVEAYDLTKSMQQRLIVALMTYIRNHGIHYETRLITALSLTQKLSSTEQCTLRTQFTFRSS